MTSTIAYHNPQQYKLSGLYLLTPDHCSERDLLDKAAAVLEAGICLLQYRDKSGDRRRQARLASQLVRLCAEFDTPLIINDSPQLALEVNAAGVHIGQSDGDIQAARALLGANAIIGSSCYASLDRAHQAIADGADYVAFGSFYASPTKPATAICPLSILQQARELPVPVVAIGGITLDNAPGLITAGADMLAVISDVFDASVPAARTAAYQSLFETSDCTSGR